VGDGSLRPEISRKAASLGLLERVIFAGWRQDVPRLMQEAMDVFILPSIFEGLPLVLMETQAAGLPAVIADNVTEEADVIKDLIIRLSLDDSPAKWAKTLISAREIKDKIKKDQALKIMEKSRFNIKLSCDKLKNQYYQLLENMP
jgi:glycosyltransferase involved in cell wall biosynthesis